MSGFLRSVFGKAGAASTGAKISETPAAISYALASFRWHMDTRPPAKVIAVHDFLGSCAVWQQQLNGCVADLPLSRLTPTEPLEVYCADLRGHNYSEAAPMPAAAAYPLACAADLIKMQEDILRCEAGLLGLGFGSLVASCAALHAPDAFASLTLFVNNTAQLRECVPAAYRVGDVLRGAPADAASVAELNRYLQDQVPDPTERAALLAAVEVRHERARFRYSKDLLAYDAPLVMSAPAEARFTKPTVVVLCEAGARCSAEEEAALRTRFPALKLLSLDAQGEALKSAKLPLVPLCLQSRGLLGEINESAMA